MLLHWGTSPERCISSSGIPILSRIRQNPGAKEAIVQEKSEATRGKAYTWHTYESRLEVIFPVCPFSNRMSNVDGHDTPIVLPSTMIAISSCVLSQIVSHANNRLHQQYSFTHMPFIILNASSPISTPSIDSSIPRSYFSPVSTTSIVLTGILPCRDRGIPPMVGIEVDSGTRVIRNDVGYR